eukprot:Hpha_TRINITY_DN15217_c0_g9::TRINITY_DN15217_c0_g9_i1::g.66367::m.66367
MLIVCVLWTSAVSSLAPSVAPSVPPTWSPCVGTKMPVVGGALSNSGPDPLCGATSCWNGVKYGCPATPCCNHSGLDMCRSNGGPNAWLRVDFSTDVIVECVNVFNRELMVPWSRRLSNHEIRVGDDPSTPQNSNVCSRFEGDSSAVQVISHTLNPPCVGRHLFVYLPPRASEPSRFINIAEVEVFGSSAPTLAPSLSPSAPSFQPTAPSSPPSIHPSSPPSIHPSSPPSI